MSLGEPSGLWLLSLLVPLVLLHLLSRQRRRRTVSALWLWRQAVESASAGRVRRWPQLNRLLLLQLAALTLIALAAARPLAGQRIARHVALVIDVSASMATLTDDGQTRLQQAVARAHRQLAAQHPDTRVLLVAAGRTPSIVRAFTRDSSSIGSALDALEPHHVAGRLAPAVALASERLAALSGETQLIVLTDRVLADRSPLLTRSVPTQIVTVGEPRANVAITRAATRLELNAPEPPSRPQRAGPEASQGAADRPGPRPVLPELSTSEPDQPELPEHHAFEHRPLRVHVFALLENYTDQPQARRVLLKQRNVRGALTTKDVVVPASGELPVVLSFEATSADRGAGLQVELLPHDALPLDDRAYLLVPESELQPVLIEHDDARWLRRALLADPGVELLEATRDELPRGALVIYGRGCPPRYPDHDFVVLAPSPGRCLGVDVGPALSNPKITHWREEDPLFRYLSLSQVAIRQAQRLHVASTRAVLVNSTGGALMVRLDSHGREGTLLGFDFGATDWPSTASFVVFVRNLIEQTRARNQAESSDGFEAGTPLTLRLPSGVERVDVRYPGGDTETLAARHGQLTLTDTVTTGFYYFSWGGAQAGSRLLPVNLTDSEESDPARVPVRTGDAEVPVARSQARLQSDNGWVFAAASLALLLVNAAWATQRRGSPGGARARDGDRS